MPDITILLPTRGRPFLVKRLFESLARTATDPGKIEIILYLDADDTASHLLGHDGLSVIRIIRPHGSDMGAIFNESCKVSSGRYIMLMNDDAVFGTMGWDERVRGAFRAFPDDIVFVYGNDMDQGEKVPTFPMLSRAACEVMGGVCPAHYRNIHIESHLIDVFRQLKALGHDRIVYLDDVIFEHMHYLVGKSPCDNTYAKKNTDADHQLFIELDEERRYMAKRLAGYIEAAEGCHTPIGARDSVFIEGSEGQRQGQGCDTMEGHRAVLKGVTPRAASRAPELSVIIPGCFDVPTGLHGAYGREELFSRSLDAVIREADEDEGVTPLRCEVIVPVSAPAESALLRALEANSMVKVIYCSGHGKLSGMFNAAALAAMGKYLVFIGPRIVPADGLIKALLRAARADAQAGVVGVKLLNPLNGRIHHAGIGFLTNPHPTLPREGGGEKEGVISGGRLEMSHLYRGAVSSDAFANRTRELQAVSGECMLVTRDAFLAAGGFNETLGGLEDVDLCLKIKRLGMKVVYEPSARAYCCEGPQDNGSMDMHMDTLEGCHTLRALWPELDCDLERLLEEDGFALRKDGRFFRCERVKSIGA